MSTERVHLPSGRSLLEMIQHSELFAALAAFFRSLSAPLEDDTEIAWEDGETEESDPKP